MDGPLEAQEHLVLSCLTLSLSRRPQGRSGRGFPFHERFSGGSAFSVVPFQHRRDGLPRAQTSGGELLHLLAAGTAGYGRGFLCLFGASNNIALTQTGIWGHRAKSWKGHVETMERILGRWRKLQRRAGWEEPAGRTAMSHWPGTRAELAAFPSRGQLCPH